MGWSAITWLLILATTATCSKLSAENPIINDLRNVNESIIIGIVNNTTPENKTIDASNVTTTTTTESTTTHNTETTSTTATATSDNISSSSQSESTGEDDEDTDEVKLPEEVEGVEVKHVVETTHGEVKGFVWRGIPELLAYIDIPYGRFEGYFKPPIPPQEWKGVHQEREHKKRCPQTVDDTYVGDLDCLTLSIFTPYKPENASVLFYIHESHFSSGSADPLKYGPEYLVGRGIILVIPNYRLGPLGFLCLRNETAPGNAALKDLTLALNWTRNNIHAFGGNPHDITVSGDGGAGALVGYLVLSSKSNSYINKAITESGSVLSHWAIDRNPEYLAENLAEKIRNRKEIFYNNTFEEADIVTIVTTAKDMTLRPCIEYGEDALLENSPWEMLHQTPINMSFMIGSANLAGARKATSKTKDSIEDLNEDFSGILPNDLYFRSKEERSVIGNRVRKLYFKDSNITTEHVQELALCCTDCSYLWPSIRIARPLVEAGSTVYMYEFSFVGDLNRELMAINETLDGAILGDLIGYLFTQDGVIPPEDTEERRVVDLVADLWASFIKTGIPTADSIEWDPLASSEDSEEVYLSIGPQCELKRGIHVDRIRVWTQIYEEHFIEDSDAITHKASVLAVLGTLVLGLCVTSHP